MPVRVRPSAFLIERFSHKKQSSGKEGLFFAFMSADLNAVDLSAINLIASLPQLKIDDIFQHSAADDKGLFQPAQIIVDRFHRQGTFVEISQCNDGKASKPQIFVQKFFQPGLTAIMQ